MRRFVAKSAAGLTIAGVALAGAAGPAGAADFIVRNMLRGEVYPAVPTSPTRGEVEVVDLDLGTLGFVEVTVNEDRSVTGSAGLFKTKDLE